MANKFILTDGQKSVNLLTSNDPSVWSGLGVRAESDDITLYSKVAAAFRAYNLKANTVGNMPFILYKGKTEFDNSATWENKVGFLPNPSELLRLNVLSYIATNTVYMTRTSDVLGYKTRGLYHAVPYSFTVWANGQNTAVDYIERQVGSLIERYDPKTGKQIYPNGKGEIVYMWRLDQTTEMLPSPNTEARSIASAAGVAFFADSWIKHFFERGGVPPTVIGMKGAVSSTKTDEEEKKWTEWLLGLGARFRSRIARVFNADTLDVKQFGSSVTELKDNMIYEQALGNIAMGTGMPLSLLMANSANYATAKEEKGTWYENDIIPFCNWLAYEYNRWVFEPIGLRMEFHPETLDPQQEDETERAQAANQFMDFMSKCPTYDVFIGTCDTFGYELSDTLVAAAEAFYKEKEEKAKEIERQMQGAGVVLGPDGKPVAQTEPKQEGDEPEEDDDEDESPAKSAVKTNETSAMIALRIPNAIRDEIKKRYSFVDEETLNNLHITLVYLGDNRTIDKMDVVRAVSDFGMYQSPIKGTLQGLARFVNGGEKDPLVVTFDSHQMPGVYNTLCNVLDNYHVPYHRDHGFIPHMTLAYIPSDADIPIETIEPIEVNFSDVYYVDGNVWLPADLTGYENKTKTSEFIPNLDQMRELQRWQDLAFRKLKRGDTLGFEWRNDTLPAEVHTTVSAQLATATDEAGIKAAFDFGILPDAPTANDDIKELAQALNKLADNWAKQSQPAST